MTIDEMLAGRYTLKLTWSDPWGALDSASQPYAACVEYSATVHDCICIARHIRAKAGTKPVDDAGLLDFFIVNMWATPVVQGSNE